MNAGSPVMEAVESALERRREALSRRQAHGTVVVGTLAAFAPPHEIIEACGCVPVRLLEGGLSHDETRGLRYVKNEACSLLKGMFGALSSRGALRPNVLILGGACDQLRRAAEVFCRDLNVPVFELFVPRHHHTATSRNRLEAELRWVTSELAAHSGTDAPDDRRLRERVTAWNRARRRMKDVAEALRLGSLTGREALSLARSLWVLGPEGFQDLVGAVDLGARPRKSRAIPVLLTGPPVLFDDEILLRTVEASDHGRVAWDVNEIGCHPHLGEVDAGGDPWHALAGRADAFPLACGFKRPDTAFLTSLEEGVARSGARGVILKGLSFCAPWNHQASRFKERAGVPVLVVEADFSKGQESRVKNRIEAFLEALSRRERSAPVPGGGAP